MRGGNKGKEREEGERKNEGEERGKSEENPTGDVSTYHPTSKDPAVLLLPHFPAFFNASQHLPCLVLYITWPRGRSMAREEEDGGPCI